MQLPQTVEVKGIRVLTSRQLAESYETTTAIIKKNFSRNRKRFEEGKHYIALTGDELKVFKNEVIKVHPVIGNEVTESHPVNLIDSRASHLYLWTEKGALLHAKSLNTDKAWEVYDYLVDFYFRAKEKQLEPAKELTYREKREAALAEIHAKEAEKREKSRINQVGFDVAPAFREIISILPIEALDEMEKTLRGNKNQAIQLATTCVLAEKIKRQFV